MNLLLSSLAVVAFVVLVLLLLALLELLLVLRSLWVSCEASRLTWLSAIRVASLPAVMLLPWIRMLLSLPAPRSPLLVLLRRCC